MATKQKNLYLYLAIACFIGIILIFVFDGYMGLYDTLSMTAGETTTEITTDQWINQDKWGFPAQISILDGEKASFSYVIDNRRFPSYPANLDVSFWQDQEKIQDIMSAGVVVRAFGKETVAWTLDTAEIATGNTTVDNRSYTMVIRHGDIERRVIVFIYSGTIVPKNVLP